MKLKVSITRTRALHISPAIKFFDGTPTNVLHLIDDSKILPIKDTKDILSVIAAHNAVVPFAEGTEIIRLGVLIGKIDSGIVAPYNTDHVFRFDAGDTKANAPAPRIKVEKVDASVIELNGHDLADGPQAPGHSLADGPTKIKIGYDEAPTTAEWSAPDSEETIDHDALVIGALENLGTATAAQVAEETGLGKNLVIATLAALGKAGTVSATKGSEKKAVNHYTMISRD